jgi:hypothetical protein
MKAAKQIHSPLPPPLPKRGDLVQICARRDMYMAFAFTRFSQSKAEYSTLNLNLTQTQPVGELSLEDLHLTDGEGIKFYDGEFVLKRDRIYLVLSSGYCKVLELVPKNKVELFERFCLILSDGINTCSYVMSLLKADRCFTLHSDGRYLLELLY